MTIQQTPPTTTPAATTVTTPAVPLQTALPPAPSPPEARVADVGALPLGAVGTLAAGGALYVLYERPALIEPAAVGGLVLVALGVDAAVTRR
ncbi:hypothetical protein AB0L80_42025 [Streptomyces sp. NPDC052069]|uniref:hypothetical protein n=1 Tax=Streptomyces sp. NPDC052069 TaxID=3154650 RepID=UPI00344823DB